MTIDDPQPVLARAREAAFENARDKATQLARLAGRGVGRVVAVSDGPASGGPVPVAFGAGKRALAAEADLQVAPGETTLTASVAVRFAWAD